MRSRDFLLVLALLVPAALFVVPRTLAGDPYPHLSGAGWTALGLVPLAMLLLVGPGRPRPFETALLVGVAGWAAARYFLGDLSDAFEARRAVVVWLLAAVGFGAGSALGAEGRRLLSEGLVLLSIALSAGALMDPDLAGTLANSGATSQAALPGAVIGAWFAAARRGAFGWLGGLAALAFIAHAVLAPVLAGALAFALGTGALLLARDVRTRTGRVRTLGLFVALPILGLLLARALPHESPVAQPVSADVPAPSDLAGAGVRARIWSTLPSAIRDAPFEGFGPGQFQAAYPPFRDPREIEASRHGVCLGGLTEVEHAHSEPLHVASELGFPAGLAFLAFLVLVARRAALAIQTDGEGTRGMGAAAFAALAAALLHASWSFVPANALASFALFGALAGSSATPRIGRVLVRAAAVGLIATAPWALDFVRHGLALRTVVAAAEVDDPDAHSTALERAVGIAPDSFPAAMGLARRTADPADPTPWLRLLEQRPHSVELLERLGHAHLAAGDPVAAADAWDRALSFSPTHPRFLRNRIRLGWESESAERADELFERLRELGCVDDDWIRQRGIDALLHGRIDAGLSVLERLEPDVNLRVGDSLHERAREATDAGATRTGEALRTAASTIWAREHAANGDFRDAVRLYRQAVLAARAGSGAPRAPTPLAIEFAAALWHADDPERARAEVEGLELDERTRRDLPTWALETWPLLDRTASAGTRAR
ncbi:MAG: hypothetical protein WD226_10225 [Planctomycetota bacterium]